MTVISSVESTNLWISGLLPLKLPMKKKFLKIFLLVQKNCLQISGGLLGVILTYNFVLQPKKREKHPLRF